MLSTAQTYNGPTKTAEIAFGNRGWPIIRDARLRECDYGDLSQHSSTEVDLARPKHVEDPFPHGESYLQVAARMRQFLEGLLRNYDGKRVMIIGHGGTQAALEHLVKGTPLMEVITAPKKWQPVWYYELEKAE